MLITINVFFLALALVFYVLFAGADFGAGILEVLTHRQKRQSMSDVIGPVWEANHVWLILIVVILFMGFPRLYTVLTTYLHIPIVLLLVGIILRGTAFTFLHYDAIHGRSNRVYTWIFRISSVLTPFFLGVIVGAIMLGRIDPAAKNFYSAFIAPWLNGFSFSVGIFCMCLFTFLSAVFMIGETEDTSDQHLFARSAVIMQLITVGSGGVVFVAGEWYGLSLFNRFLSSPAALSCIILATLTLFVLWRVIKQKHIILARLVAGFQIILILFGWFQIQQSVIKLSEGQDLTFINTAAPNATLLQLVWALIIGSLIILPSLFFLIKTFKGSQFSRK